MHPLVVLALIALRFLVASGMAVTDGHPALALLIHPDQDHVCPLHPPIGVEAQADPSLLPLMRRGMEQLAVRDADQRLKQLLQEQLR